MSSISLEQMLKAGPAPTPERSRAMSRVRSQDTKPELVVRKALHAAGLRFRLHARDLPGRPDIVLPSRRIAILVHGCFWHRHQGCRYTRMPKTRREFWEAKFERNERRDGQNAAKLREAGWTPVVVWECETRDTSRLAEIVLETLNAPRVGVLPRV